MKYLLIAVMLTNMDYAPRPVSVTVPFENKEACDRALADMKSSKNLDVKWAGCFPDR